MSLSYNMYITDSDYHRREIWSQPIWICANLNQLQPIGKEKKTRQNHYIIIYRHWHSWEPKHIIWNLSIHLIDLFYTHQKQNKHERKHSWSMKQNETRLILTCWTIFLFQLLCLLGTPDVGFGCWTLVGFGVTESCSTVIVFYNVCKHISSQHEWKQKI